MLTDAGFHTPWFRSVEALGWDWIGRHRGRIMIRIDRPHAAWCSVSTYYDKAPIKSESLGICDITRSRPTSCYLVRTRRRPKVRHQTRRDRRRAGRKRWPRDIESPGCWLRPAGWRTKARPRLRDFTGCACRSRPRFVISSPINMAARSRTHRPGRRSARNAAADPHAGYPRGLVGRAGDAIRARNALSDIATQSRMGDFAPNGATSAGCQKTTVARPSSLFPLLFNIGLICGEPSGAVLIPVQYPEPVSRHP